MVCDRVLPYEYGGSLPELGWFDLAYWMEVGRLWVCADLIKHNHMYLLFHPTFDNCGFPINPLVPFSVDAHVGHCYSFFSPDTVFMCTWSGQLPPRRYMNPTYSPRIFLGGVPWDITESSLLATFQQFGALVVDWPGKEGKHARHPPKGEI